MKKTILSFLLLILVYSSFAQLPGNKGIHISLKDENNMPVHSATVILLSIDSVMLITTTTDKSGIVLFKNLAAEKYKVHITHTGFESIFLSAIDFKAESVIKKDVILKQTSATLKDVVVTAKKQFVEFAPDKTIINVDAGIGNAGATVMDVLERSPGITVGRDGTISMKGKPQVMVLIDGKQTQLGGADLQAYLSGMNASQVDVIELIDNPGAKYDAAGNAGIINIKTKKNRQKGFNGSLSVSLGQGIYTKNNNSFSINYRTGKINLYANYGTRLGKERMKLYALRKYFDTNGIDSLLLEQPNVTNTKISAHNLRTGIDFFASEKTTFGLAFTGNLTTRNSNSLSTIDWMSPAFVIDSTISTSGTRYSQFKRAGVNLNMNHRINSSNEITTDIDFIKFTIDGNQLFQTQVDAPVSIPQSTRGNIPSSLEIFTAKVDYSKKFSQFVWEAGLKTASTNTDNLAQYYFNDGTSWYDDLSRSNHFLYDEKIHSAYSSIDADHGQWHWQAGLRYELTSYKANQLGNTVIKDSSFRREYGSLFPSAFVSFNADSSNNLTLRFGRRIDRPQFQSLNPFLVTLNKYTFEGGNPFIRPQYTWNVELIHTFKQKLSTGISYSYLKDYFSQLFIIDSNSSNVNKNIIIYTRGNVGTFHNLGLTASLQQPITKWWSVTAVAVFNRKIIEGFIWAPFKATVNQLNISLNNQFQFKKGWAAEISGYYLSNSQIDLQETLTPQGEIGFGISKQILKNKGTFRFNMRDIFYTQNYSGYSKFENADEPFEVKWDSRVARITFSWRFGKTMKPVKRSGGGATEETERVGTGN